MHERTVTTQVAVSLLTLRTDPSDISIALLPAYGKKRPFVLFANRIALAMINVKYPLRMDLIDGLHVPARRFPD